MPVRFGLRNLRAAIWTARALVQVRHQLTSRPVEKVRLHPPPQLPEAAFRGVAGTLCRLPNSCLARALVLQAWHQAHGRRPEVVIGVKGGADDFAAHAWIDGSERDHEKSFSEIYRVPPNGER